MCGIVGYIGEKNSINVLMEGLKNLEYRGYDSAGVSFLEDNKIKTIKCVGPLDILSSKLKSMNAYGNCGIGHTRWATHGVPSEINAHPHTGTTVSIVHNGIIENFLEIKSFLEDKGTTFLSDTDTEIVAKLIDYHYKGNPLETIKKVLSEIKGSYAFGIIFNDHENTLYAAKKESPLVVGIGDNENFICSDISAILKYTKKYKLIEDNDIIILTKDSVKITDINGKEIKRKTLTADWNIELSEKGDFEHFMLKEIFEQPEAFRKTISPKIKNNLPDFGLDGLTIEDFSKFKNIYIVACGTAMHAGLIGKSLIESIARVKVNVEIASEFRYNNPILNKDDLVVAISQSGETADTIAAIKLAKTKGVTTLAIVNVLGSSISHIVDHIIYTLAGPEISVASTKAYSVQVSVMYLLAFSIALSNKSKTEIEIKDLIKKLCEIPDKIKILLNKNDEIKEISKNIQKSKSVFYIGRNLDYYLAQEASLKLKEISYIHSEAYASGELKHGTISLIEKDTPVIAMCTQSNLYEKSVSNIKEVISRGANVILICKNDTKEKSKLVSNNIISIPDIDDIFTPLLSIIPCQLIAYHVSNLNGCNVDKPRNLAKSVTVE
ncbi:MAG: glutamine--fructose-6-phosphate transaminase (isomerizing) [Oscillospiraceae bacterium]